MSLIYLKVRTLSHVFILSHQKGVTIKGKGPKKRRVKFNTFAIRARHYPFRRRRKSGLVVAHAMMVGVMGIYRT